MRRYRSPPELAVARFAIALALVFTVFDDIRRQLEMPEVPFAGHLAASLYGGIVEELLLRAGVLTVLAWARARVTRQPFGHDPHPLERRGPARGLHVLLDAGELRPI